MLNDHTFWDCTQTLLNDILEKSGGDFSETQNTLVKMLSKERSALTAAALQELEYRRFMTDY